jgi:hypothetical protein
MSPDTTSTGSSTREAGLVTTIVFDLSRDRRDGFSGAQHSVAGRQATRNCFAALFGLVSV